VGLRAAVAIDDVARRGAIHADTEGADLGVHRVVARRTGRRRSCRVPPMWWPAPDDLRAVLTAGTLSTDAIASMLTSSMAGRQTVMVCSLPERWVTSVRRVAPESPPACRHRQPGHLGDLREGVPGLVEMVHPGGLVDPHGQVKTQVRGRSAPTAHRAPSVDFSLPTWRRCCMGCLQCTTQGAPGAHPGHTRGHLGWRGSHRPALPCELSDDSGQRVAGLASPRLRHSA
jgi:hypothetical protein